MSSDQALLAICAICRKGPSCDRVLLCCGSQACTSGSWFHSDCIGPAIVSRNVKKSQRHWLCPWCVLNQISTLSERQLLALTLHISHLDSLRCSVTRSVEHSSDLAFSIHTLTPELSSCSTMCPSMETPPPPHRNSSTNKKRSMVVRSDSDCPLPDVADAEFSRTCAKCRPLRLPNGMRHPKRINCGISHTSSYSQGSPQRNPDMESDLQVSHASAASTPIARTHSATCSDMRSARASFRRNSSSLLSEFDSSVLRFSSSLSFKNPSAFRQCWRQGRSQMHGWGLFANEFIPPGQRITEYTGELLRPRVSDLREMRYRAEGLHSTYFFRLDGSFVIDATRKGNVARYVNHSCGPNCEPRLVVADGKHHIVLISKTAISKGEELCYDYKLPLDGTEQPCLYVSLPVPIITSCEPYL